MFQISMYHPDIMSNPSKYISSDLLDFSIYFDNQYLYTTFNDKNSYSSHNNRYPIYKYPIHMDTNKSGNLVYSLKLKFLGYELFMEANESDRSIKYMIPISDNKISPMGTFDKNHLFIVNGKISTPIEFVNAVFQEIDNIFFTIK